MERRYANLAAVETRERQSLEIALKRREFQCLREETAAARSQAGIRQGARDQGGHRQPGTGGGLSAKFRHHAEGIGLPKGDLQAAFERATAGKDERQPIAAKAAPPPPILKNSNEARKARDQFRSRQPRPGPDKDRER